MRRFRRALVAVVVLAVVLAITVVSVRASNGDFSGQYKLTGYFPGAGEGLNPGSEVVYRGVQVGRVGAIALVGTRAKVTLLIDPGFQVPADTKATVEPVNLFGAEQVSLSIPGGHAAALGPGATLASTATSDELGTLFRAAAPLLQKITTASLADVVGELAQASAGEGPAIKRSIEAGANLASYLSQSLAAQLTALDSFSQFSAAIAGDGSTINGLSAQENIALPAFNQDAADYTKLLSNLNAFSTQLAALLTDYHPTLVTLLADGANPARVLTAQQTQIGEAIRGLYSYAYKIGTSRSTETLPDGSHFVYFSTFILFTDINDLVCDLIAPPKSGLSYLEPLQQALTGAGTPFTCSSQLAAFDALQSTTGTTATTLPITLPVTTPTTTPTAPVATPAPSTNPLTTAVKSIGTALYGIVGQPSNPAAESVGGYVGALLGGGS